MGIASKMMLKPAFYDIKRVDEQTYILQVHGVGNPFCSDSRILAKACIINLDYYTHARNCIVVQCRLGRFYANVIS